MKERKSTTIKKQKVLEAFAKSGGNSTVACQNADVARSTFYKWQEEDMLFAAKIEGILQAISKCAQDKIMLAALQGNIQAWKKKAVRANRKLSNKR